MTEDKLIALQENLGYRFQNKDFLIQAFTHATFAYEHQQEEVYDNRRLEFLGDSILGFVVAEYLYEEYPNFSEGELTRRRSLLVNNNNLVEKANKMDLSRYLFLGKGEEKIGGRRNCANLSGSLEAVIGAIYLDGGYAGAKKFILEKIT